MSDKMETAGEVRKLRRELGLCVDCGGPIEEQKRGYKVPLIRCAACREQLTQRKYELKRIRKQQEARRAEAQRRTRLDYRPSRTMCERCEWATYVGGGIWFCPLAVCKLAKIADVVSE